ncbi:MAG: HXXEE domain-containing protein [Hyphomicrobiales bacterium]|nr:HXXEE domain-containing protein [Hyphomicrobiales bacterium]
MTGLRATIIERWPRALPWLIVPILAGLLPALPLAAGSLSLLLALHFPVYMVHQIEEHLWPGGFRTYVNREIFHSPDPEAPASAEAIAFVNIVLVLIPLMLGAIPRQLQPGFVWIGLVMLAVSLVNSLAHTGLAIVRRQRNPGLVSAIFLLLPFSLWGLHVASQRLALGWPQYALLMLAALALHGLVAALIAAPWRHTRHAGP